MNNGDLISRSALLVRLKKVAMPDDLYSLGIQRGVEHAKEVIAEAPAVDAGSKWISVKDALPEESVFVLCVLNGRYKNVSYEDAYVIGTYYADEGWILEEAPRWENPPVTHWMPLPEPPKEVRR